MVKVSESYTKWKNNVYVQGRHENIWLNSLHVMPNITIFATQEEWMDRRTQLTAQISIVYMILIWIKKKKK